MAKTVCIIGAGPAGLVAAKTLSSVPSSPFRVTVYDPRPRVGGLWPNSPTDSGGLIHPRMVANQSRHTIQFNDHSWPAGAPQIPPAWQVGQYLEDYARRWLDGRVEIALGTRVVAVKRNAAAGNSAWLVTTARQSVEVGDGDKTDSREFDCLLVAAGFFGSPVVDPDLLAAGAAAGLPVVHSSQYRDLETLLGREPRRGTKIVVVGAQMSGVEIAGTIASHVSSAQHSPGPSPVPNADQLRVHHLIQRPVWVFPLFTSPQPDLKAPSFLPIDMSFYNLGSRPPGRLVNTQGHTSEEAGRVWHAIFQAVLGTDQADISPLLSFAGPEAKDQLPYIAISDHYSEFARERMITLHQGKLSPPALRDGKAVISPSGEEIEDVAAIVLATGFGLAKLDFLPRDVLETLGHRPDHLNLPLALAFHDTHHQGVPNLGFVGCFRSPYWGLLEMQARFLAALWTPPDAAAAATAAAPGRPTRLSSALSEDVSIQRTLELRQDPRCSQYPTGDYAFIMAQFAEALDTAISPPPPVDPPLPRLPPYDQPFDCVTPARYSATPEHPDVVRSLAEAHDTISKSFTSPLFVARATFRSLLGTWRLERDICSRLPSLPSGRFTGTARFLPRAPTTEARLRVSDPAMDGNSWLGEYHYTEDGEFQSDDDSSVAFRASRKYVWRYDENRDVMSVWFVKPDVPSRVDYLFHEVEFVNSAPADRADGWRAGAGHMCVDDYYDVKYEFAFKAVNLERWTVEYGVRGPAKDYTIRGVYTR